MRINVRALQIIIRIIVIISIIVILGLVSFLIVVNVGKNKLYQEADTKAPVMITTQTSVLEEEIPEEDVEIWQEGDVRYNGQVYRYNKDMLTFLALGIDDRGKVQASNDYTKGGQSDALFLIAINPHNKKVSVIAIPRDTITEIDVYDKNNNFLSTVEAQITLQHGYGDGMELSCERSVKAVSNLFYQLPIHGYASVGVGAVPVLNDFVGGIDIELMEQIPNGSPEIKNKKVGDMAHLSGWDAYNYLVYRSDEFASANQRLARQKQYVSAFITAAKEKTQKKLSFPIDLYNKIKSYVVTDVDVAKMSYLATELINYKFDDTQMYSLKGETKMGEKFEEFHPDEKALYELVMEIFYEPVQK